MPIRQGEPVEQLAPQVRRNCLRADAQVAGRFSVCGLLMRLRNQYKWEHGLEPWREEEPAVMLDWVSRREDLWQDCEGEAPEPLNLAQRDYDPFDVEGINELLEPTGWIYGAGWAGGAAPAFFLGRLKSKTSQNGLIVCELAEELAPDILLLPGLRQEGRIYLRRRPFAYLLWDKLTDPRKSVRRFVRFALQCYGLDSGRLFKNPAWEELAPVFEGELRGVFWHEMGEAGQDGPAGDLLRKALAEHPGTDLEHFVRGVKDLLADTAEGGRLDSIIREKAAGALGLYPAWLGGFPRLLFPEIDAAVMDFMEDGQWDSVDDVRRLGRDRALEALNLLAPLMEGRDPDVIRQKARQQVIGPLTGQRRLAN